MAVLATRNQANAALDDEFGDHKVIRIIDAAAGRYVYGKKAASSSTLVDTVATLAGLVATARVGQAYDVYADPIVTNNGRYLAHGAVGANVGDPAVAIVR